MSCTPRRHRHCGSSRLVGVGAAVAFCASAFSLPLMLSCCRVSLGTVLTRVVVVDIALLLVLVAALVELLAILLSRASSTVLSLVAVNAVDVVVVVEEEVEGRRKAVKGSSRTRCRRG